MKRFRLFLMALGTLLALMLPTQTVGAFSSAPFIFLPASQPYFSPAAQLSSLDGAAPLALDTPWHGGASELLAKLKNVEVNNPSQDGNSLQWTQAESAVAIYKSHVVVGFNDTTDFHFHGQHLSGCIGSYAYSSDGGASFTDGRCTPFPPGGVSFGDPIVAVDPTGAFYYGQVERDANGNEFMGVAKSIDGGKTWSQPVNASPKVHTGRSGVPFQDKDWLSVGINPSNHSQFILYASWTHFNQTTAVIQVSRSADGGKSWSTPANLQTSPNVQGSYTTEDPGSGKAYAFWVNYGKGLNTAMLESASTDGGQTWSKAKVIYSLRLGVNAVVNCGGVKQGVIQFIPGDTKHVALNDSFPQASVDPATHNVYVVNTERVSKHVAVFLLSSADGGNSWHTQLVAPNAGPQFQASIAVDRHGIHLEYYQVSSDGTYYEAGINGNLAVPPVFGHPFAVSNKALPPPVTNPESDPVLHPCQMGDYNQMAADSHSITYTWADTRHFNKSGLDIWSATTSG